MKRNVNELEGVEVVEHPDAELPLDAKFKDDAGKDIKLGDYFQSGRPAILSLNYSNCPMLCSLQLNGLVEVLQEMDLSRERTSKLCLSASTRSNLRSAATNKTTIHETIWEKWNRRRLALPDRQESEIARLADAPWAFTTVTYPSGTSTPMPLSS